MTIERVAPEHITVSDSETALKVTQTGSGNAFVVEDSTSPDSSAFVIDNQGRVGIKKTPTRDLDVDGVVSATNVVPGYATTATSGGSTALTATSAQQQFFTGTQGHTVVLPVASTLSLGHFFTIHNNSTGALTINSSGGNLVKTLGPSTTGQFTCILTSGTTAASWDADTAEGSAYATTVTANGTTTLSVSSAQRQFFTGTQGQTVVLPAVNTLTLGQFYIIENNSAGSIAVQSSGLNAVVTVPANRSVQLTAIATTGTDASVWDVEYGGASTPLATTSYVDTSISNLVDAAPGALDTLNELAAALGDDANFATTVTNALAGKVNDTGDTITGELVISANTSGNALRVTQTGAGDALRVEDEANPDATPFIVKSDGSVGVGTATPTEKLAVVGDISATGSVISDELSSSLAQEVLSEAVFYIDATDPGNDPNKVQNLGTGGSLLDATLGSTATADSNDPKYLEWDGENYVYLPGVSGNFLSVPDEAALDITGDLDIRVHLAKDSWTSAVSQVLVSKRNASGTEYSWSLFANATSGTLELNWSASGSSAVSTTTQSTVGVSVADESDIWVRATLDVDNGASGNTTKYFTSDDGVTWTQLGSDVVLAGTTSVYSGTADVRIGAQYSGGTNGPIASKVYRAQVLDGIDGTKVLDVDTSVITSGSDTSFTALTGQTVTINRSTSGRKSVAVTQPTWLFGTDDYMEVTRPAPEDDTYISLPGISGSYLSVPDEAALDITGDIDIRVQVSLNDWTPGTTNTLVSKYGSSGTRSYILQMTSAPTLQLVWSVDGTAVIARSSSVATGISDGTVKWVRATLDVDNGASGHDVKFYTSDDGVTWTQLGSTVTSSGTTSIFSGSSSVNIGSHTNGLSNLTSGRIYRAQILNGINGTTVLDVDARYAKTGDTSFNAATGQTVTVNGDASVVESAYASALDFGADDSFTVVSVIRQWETPISSRSFLSKSSFSGPFDGYVVRTLTTSQEIQAIVDDGPNSAGSTTTSSPTAGILRPVGMIVNRSSQTLIAYTNNLLGGSSSITTVGSLANSYPLRIGRYGAGFVAYQDFEFIAAIVIRRALTAVEIAALNNYFTTRPAGGQTLTVKAPTLLVEGNVEVTGNGNRLIGPGAVYSVTSTTRPTNPVEGDVIYERDTKLFFGWDGSLWKSIGGGAKGGGTDDVFYENAQTVTTSYTLTTNKNAMTAGPVTINSGATVTVPSGSNWVVV